jgi:hypothetical protein
MDLFKFFVCIRFCGNTKIFANEHSISIFIPPNMIDFVMEPQVGEKMRYIKTVFLLVVLVSCVGVGENRKVLSSCGLVITSIGEYPPFFSGFISSYIIIVVLENNQDQVYYLSYLIDTVVPEFSKTYCFYYVEQNITGWIEGDVMEIQNARLIKSVVQTEITIPD